MDANNLDRHITGNWGEDSVAPEFIAARKLGDFGVDQEVVIDAAPQTDEKQIPVTVREVSISSGMVYVTTKELAYRLVIPENETVWFAVED